MGCLKRSGGRATEADGKPHLLNRTESVSKTEQWAHRYSVWNPSAMSADNYSVRMLPISIKGKSLKDTSAISRSDKKAAIFS